MSEALSPDEPSYHAKLDASLRNQEEMGDTLRALGMVLNQVKIDVAEQGRDTKKIEKRMDKMDLNGSAQTLKAMAKPGGPVDALVALAPEIINRMTYATTEQQELTDYALAHADELLPALPVIPGMATAYVKEKTEAANKQRVRAEVWGYLAAPFRRFGRLGGALGAIGIAVVSVVASHLLEHIHL